MIQSVRAGHGIVGQGARRCTLAVIRLNQMTKRDLVICFSDRVPPVFLGQRVWRISASWGVRNHLGLKGIQVSAYSRSMIDEPVSRCNTQPREKVSCFSSVINGRDVDSVALRLPVNDFR